MKIAIALGCLLTGTVALAAGPTAADMLMGQMQHSKSRPIGQTMQGKPVTAIYKGEYKSGQSKVCVYNNAGSDFVMTIGATEICPR